jgi:hypothetical protein
VATTLATATPISLATGAVVGVEDHLNNLSHPATVCPSAQHVKFATSKATQKPHAGLGMIKATKPILLRCKPT